MPIINPNDLTQLIRGIDKTSDPRHNPKKISLVTTRENHPFWNPGKVLSALNTGDVISLNNGTDRIALADIMGFGADGPLAS